MEIVGKKCFVRFVVQWSDVVSLFHQFELPVGFDTLTRFPFIASSVLWFVSSLSHEFVASSFICRRVPGPSKMAAVG